jgi:hypothetical protein
VNEKRRALERERERERKKERGRERNRVCAFLALG